MLDSDTKRRIDTARNILVGKVPDPKSQVEQITLALIYKFMDDMDSRAEELGGKRAFFAGEFQKYAWAKLMAPGVGGHERLGLYGESLARMNQNPGIPALFRDIFKNAFLPYRDPETLSLFLKTIDGFVYDHSERLGDAFEYLLSVLGAQGDAGQFRTPRHIIDFIVKIVDPRKNESILDPACGTAGFLISAYKHILATNKDEGGRMKGANQRMKDEVGRMNSAVPSDSSFIPHPSSFSPAPLTPDEKQKLAANLRGYDISPDMVRLSLVNLYLHGFVAPRIDEYDTLTSQDKWNQTADIILANPPFMSPKGGIKPHDRFSITSKRSEVLFVDYIAEHLSPGGRAGVIVPEGIIFQSQNAYKALRKMLVENYLIAVISLPAGVFNPYSGVKTSILILDKSRAKQSDTIGFFKVESDGFSLGAQRRPIDANDLPDVLGEIKTYLAAPLPRPTGGGNSAQTPSPVLKGNAAQTPSPVLKGNAAQTPSPVLKGNAAQTPSPVVLNGGGQGGGFSFPHALIVPKSKIAANGDYNLSGERYRDVGAGNHAYPLVRLAGCEAFVIKSGGTPKSGVAEYWDGNVAWATLVDLPATDFITRITNTRRKITMKGLDESSAELLPENSVIVSTRATIGRIAINRIPIATNQGFKSVVIRDSSVALPEYVALALTRLVPTMQSWATGGTFAEISKKQFGELQIPLPPLSVQKEIVAEIEGYQKVIDGARAVIDHYRPHIPIQDDWPRVTIGDVSTRIQYGLSHALDADGKGFKTFRMNELVEGVCVDRGDMKNADISQEDFEKYQLERGDLLFNRTNSFEHVGRTGIFDLEGEYCFASYLIRLSIDTSKAVPRYINAYMNSARFQEGIKQFATRAIGQSNINAKSLAAYPIPLPPLPVQKDIVAGIEAERALVEGNRRLIDLMEQRIAAVLGRIWGEEGGRDEG